MTKTSHETGLIFRNAGDRGILIELGLKIDPGINHKVRAVAKALELNPIKGITQIIPTYRSVLLIYDPLVTQPDKFKAVVRRVAENIDSSRETDSSVVQIPVCYGGEFGPDMKNVQKASGLLQSEVIDLHSAPEYLIYMIGFTPGFPFLGGLDRRLFTPRLKTPRVAVPKGSVGIANNQTGMYPNKSPGGWQIIGRTPVNLFDPHRKHPFLYKAGDKIKFVPVSEEEFREIETEENH